MNRPLWRSVNSGFPYFVLKDIPRFAAITLVAPGDRFNALAILVTPRLPFAIDFSVRKSSFDHGRRIIFFCFLANFGSFL